MNELTRTIAKSVGRHFVSLSCVQTCPDGSQKLLVFSGFVIEIAGEWFYVTAGHVLSAIEKAGYAGSSFGIWRLGDQTAKQNSDGIGIPYDFDENQWLVIDNEEQGLDFAVVPLSGIVRSALEAGGIEPIPKGAWASHLVDSGYWVLCGIPSETVEYDGKSVIQAKFNVIPLERCADDYLNDMRATNQFCAKLPEDLGKGVSDIDGMSGGPIFAVLNEPGLIRYSVVGVQSSWLPGEGVVLACAFPNFALELERLIVEILNARPQG